MPLRAGAEPAEGSAARAPRCYAELRHVPGSLPAPLPHRGADRRCGAAASWPRPVVAPGRGPAPAGLRDRAARTSGRASSSRSTIPAGSPGARRRSRRSPSPVTWSRQGEQTDLEQRGLRNLEGRRPPVPDRLGPGRVRPRRLPGEGALHPHPHHLGPAGARRCCSSAPSSPTRRSRCTAAAIAVRSRPSSRTSRMPRPSSSSTNRCPRRSPVRAPSPRPAPRSGRRDDRAADAGTLRHSPEALQSPGHGTPVSSRQAPRRLYLLLALAVFVLIAWGVCTVYVRPNEFAVKQVTVGRHKGILPGGLLPGPSLREPGDGAPPRLSHRHPVARPHQRPEGAAQGRQAGHPGDQHPDL